MTTAGRRLVWTGSIVLAATAAFHGSGYPDITRVVETSNLEGMLRGAAGGLWLFVSLHWLFLALLAIVAAHVPSRLSPWVLGLAAGVLAVDVVILLVFVGPFIGELMLAASATAFAVAARSYQ